MNGRLATLVGIFQQADYDPILFRAWLRRHPAPEEWMAFEKTAAPHWTAKARILFWIAFAKSLGISRLAPSMLLFARSVIQPFEKIALWTIARRARKKLQKIKFHEVIGITGSFGKTTAKEAIAQVLTAKFRVHKTPENKNTLLGIARWILGTADFRDGDVLIIEMGAYHPGDIAAICRMTQPTIGVLTGLNEAHLERFGTIENTTRTKAELIEALPAGGALFSEVSPPNLANFLQENKDRWRSIAFVPYRGYEECASRVGKHFGVSEDRIAEVLASFRLPERRFSQTLAPGNRLIIDDSYNITLDGARRAIEVLKKIPRRTIGVFAGIPEAGQASERVNRELGKLIAEAFEIILLRKTPYEVFIRAGLEKAGFAAEKIIPYTETGEVQPLLSRIVKDGDCVYFSAYDLPAIYL